MTDTTRTRSRRKSKAVPEAATLASSETEAVPEARTEAGAGTEAETATVTDTEAAAGAAAAGGDVLLEDWTPLGQCLDLRIGHGYWAGHAHELFADHLVPTLAHDSGAVSQRSARVLYAWCQDLHALGRLPAEIVVAELGMGTGLHLRFLLDAFRDRCQAAGTDFYERLRVFATDVSAPTVRRAMERRLFAPHAARVRLGYMDVLNPGRFAEIDTGATEDLRGRIHVLVANYVLDLLPVDVFRRVRGPDGATRWDAVLVRTWLRRAEQLDAYGDLGLEQIRALATDPTPGAAARLAPYSSLLQLELRAWPVDLEGHPDLAELERVADAQEAALGTDHEQIRDGTIVNHSAGALRAARLIAEALHGDGFALLRDVGLVDPELASVPRVYQKYGPTGAAGVNLVQLDGWFAREAPGGARLLRPHHDGVRNHAARLLTRGHLPGVQAEFEIAFDGQDLDRPSELARQARAEPDPVAAMETFRQAVLLEPTNWHLMAEAARKALADAHRPDVALAIAHKGLELNPEYSAELWSVYGDALLALGDPAAARQAYGNGLQIQPKDARLHYAVAWTEARRGRYAEAFRHLGEALANDPAGRVRGEALQLLDACLRGQALQHQDEQARLATRNDR